MDILWVYIESIEEKVQFRELLGLEPVSLVISRIEWDGLDLVIIKDDADWIKHCMTMDVDGTRQR